MGALLAEFIGTFALIFCGVGAITTNALSNGGSGLLGVALAHGLAIAVFGSALGAISGGHFNPAVTLSLLATRRTNANKALQYIIVQCLGATAASLILTLIFSPEILAAVHNGIPSLGGGVSWSQGFTLEVIMTFFLVFTVFGTCVDGRAPKMGALFVGLSIVFDILIGGPLTGAAMNPARYIGPALVEGNLNDIALYFGAPIVGGLIAAVAYEQVIRGK